MAIPLFIQSSFVLRNKFFLFDYQTPATTVDKLRQRAIVQMSSTRISATNLTTLAARFRYARERRGLTQAELAKAAMTSQQVVQNIESGKSKKPRKIEALARVLEVSPAWLQFGIEELDSLDKDAVMLAISWMSLSEPHKSAMKNAIMEMAKKRKKP